MNEETVDRNWGLATVAGTLPALFVILAIAPMFLIASELIEPIRALGAWFWGIAFIGVLATFGTAALTLLSAAGFRVPPVAPVLVACSPWFIGLLSVAVGTKEASAAVAYAAPESFSELMAAVMWSILPARAIGGWISGALLAGVAVGFGLGAVARRAPDRSGIGMLVGGAVGLGLLGVAAAGAAPPMAVGVSDNLGLFMPALAGLIGLGLAALGAGRDAQAGQSGALAIGAAGAATLALAATAASLSSLAIAVAGDAMRSAPPDMQPRILGRGVEAASASEPVVLYAAGAGVVALLVMAVWAALRTRNLTSVAVTTGTVSLVCLATLGADVAAVGHLARSMDFNSERLYDGLDGFEPVRMRGGVSRHPSMAIRGSDAVVSDGPTMGRLHDYPLRKLSIVEAFAQLIPEGLGPDGPVPMKDLARREEPEVDIAVAVALDRRTDRAATLDALEKAADAGFRYVWLVGRPSELEFAGPILDFPLSRPLLTRTRAVRVFLPSPVPAEGDDDLQSDAWRGQISAKGAFRIHDPREQRESLTFEVGVDSPTNGSDEKLAFVTLADGVDVQRLTDAVDLMSGAGLDVVVFRKHREASPQPNAPMGINALAGAPNGGSVGAGGGGPVVLGALDRSTIQTVIRRHLPAVKACYQRELQQSPSLQGKVTIKMVISSAGAVSTAEVEASTLGNTTVGACLTRVAKGMTFPAPQGGGIVIVRYPFVFSPG